MLKLTSKIHVGPFQFTGVTDVRIVSSWATMADVCELKIPRKSAWQGRPIAMGRNPILQRGDVVKVHLGYNGSNASEFEGFLTTINAIDSPLTIACQDALFLLKRVTRKISYKSVSLRTLVTDLIGDLVPFEVLVAMELGSYRWATPVSPAEVLDNLKEKYCIASFFRGGTLYVGLTIVPKLQKTHLFNFTKNVVSSHLEYCRKEDVRLKLKAVIFNQNRKEETETGDSDGQVRTFHYRNISKADAKNRLEQEMERLKYDGFKGDFTAFGAPSVQHGDIASLINPFLPEQNGRYLIKSVEKTFGSGGYRQKIELEGKL